MVSGQFVLNSNVLRLRELRSFQQLQGGLILSPVIVHDPAVVKNVCDRVAVMYLGRLCELAPAEALYRRPAHPYTAALLSAVPEPDPTRPPRPVAIAPGEIPSPLDPPPGCHFHPRCPFAMARCKTERPALKVIAPQRTSACHLNDQP